MKAPQKKPSQSRRDFLSLMTGVPLAWNLPQGENWLEWQENSFPAKEMFELKGTFLNAAYTHPMSRGSFEAVKKFLNERMVNRVEPKGFDAFERASIQGNFAKLINASPEEIAWVPSTMVGENLIVSGLSFPGSKEHVVTDAFHFHGSLHLYGQLAKQGLNLTVVKPRNNQIDLNDLDKAITPGTKLVAVSLVSATTGFQHDLKKVCALAHSRGAMVYADIIQAAGAVPVDVQDSQVDFCATATYKWLMGDFGVGFLYVRKDRLPMMKRALIGYRQMKSFVSHVLPFEPQGENVFDSESLENMSGHFEVGTFANGAIAALRFSLDYLNRTGVSNIQQYRQPMINKLQQALPQFGFQPLTPSDSTSPIVSYAYKDAAKILKPKLEAADITISLYEHMVRISPSFFNEMSEVDKLVDVLKKA
ncbi:MAG TPA: aminotransferase class V-fold PLP-dependent enzyme [Cyclobacteriaceae bacterium]|nr:aminotransferase class V-fold PLP-dependent enzyme [Cyclobacteriaceae bacterium]